MSDDSLKSAYELALERLRRKDDETGGPPLTLTDDQKAAIADVRKVYEARLAQEDILHQSQMRATIDPAARDELDAQYRQERGRLVSERDAKIEQIRRERS